MTTERIMLPGGLSLWNVVLSTPHGGGVVGQSA